VKEFLNEESEEGRSLAVEEGKDFKVI